MQLRPLLITIPSVFFAGIAFATDWDDCASAARNLRNAAEEAVSAQSSFESAKSSYESACGSYGYDRNSEYACGRYGYHRSELESAKTRLDSAASEVESYASKTANRCNALNSPVQSVFFKQIRILQHELSSVKQELDSCKNSSSQKGK